MSYHQEHLFPAKQSTPSRFNCEQAAIEVVERTRQAWLAAPQEFLSLEEIIGVGIGFAALTRNGRVVYEEDCDGKEKRIKVCEAEQMARQSTGHDWCVHLVGLVEERHYKRIGKSLWKLYKRGPGLLSTVPTGKAETGCAATPNARLKAPQSDTAANCSP